MSSSLKKVAINGFGRMGRLGFRAAWDQAESLGYEIVAINELHGHLETAAHLLEFDTVHGTWERDISFEGEHLIVQGKHIAFSQKASPRELDWQEVDIVVECTGAFRTLESLQPYLDQGVERVVVAAPVKGALNVVMGCNNTQYQPSQHSIVTAASCTTNGIAPVVKVIQEQLGIVHGVMTTLHNVTNTQVVVDAPHKDLRRARSALNSLIPTSTGSATAITMIYPELTGKLDGVAVRVPLLNASLIDAVFEVGRETTVEEVNQVLKEASENELKGILGYEERPLVSTDYLNDSRSGVVDALSTMVTDQTLVKLLVWYDNEVGYANRLMELVAQVASQSD